ncbi:hypothetical protein PYJP_16360 [Pyrofollis japonicus]|nr:hypothetical protein PYJP_16360 [Pyrofollis japonicus]
MVVVTVPVGVEIVVVVCGLDVSGVDDVDGAVVGLVAVVGVVVDVLPPPLE